MTLKGEVWCNGQRLTYCRLDPSSDAVPDVVGTTRHLPDGNYEIRSGSVVYEFTLRYGQWQLRTGQS